MSHLVESIAWANTVPWHGLGVKVDDTLNADQMLKAANLDWTVSKRRLSYATASDDLEAKDFYGLVRDSDDKLLDVIGNRYQPTQNVEAFEFFNDFVHAGQAKMDTAGSLKGGRMVWGLASLQDGFTLAGGDKVKGYILVALPHEQGKSIQVRFTSIRVVCNNTITLAMRGKSDFSMSHRLVFDTANQKRAKEMMGIAREQLDEHADVAKKLASTRISHEDVSVVLAKLLDDTLAEEPARVIVERIAEGKVNKNLSIVMQALEHSPGAGMISAKGTAWGAVNAVTYSVDHLFGKGQDQRMVKAWFGSGSALKARALAAFNG